MPEPVIQPTTVVLVTALLAAPLTAVIGWWRPAWAARAAIAAAGAAFAAALWGWSAGGEPIDIAWAPSWGLRLSFALDDLATLYALLATGIGLAVLIYAGRYLPLHLAHDDRPPADATPLYAFILLFMGAMVGLVMAQDLLLIYLFWDLTAIASYFLIGYDRHHDEARRAALMAFLVTGISAVCFLIGAVLLERDYGTFALDDLAARIEANQTVTTAGALMMVAALAKSAQTPLHFWLPRAMAAPTPVSAYLHSAAMVAAGVFLLARIYPLLMPTPRLLDALAVVGFGAMAVGGVWALTRDGLKQILAYSTISHYGYVAVLLGLGGEYGVAGAAFYVVAHALAKSALFLTAGAVTESTGASTLSAAGGLARSLPTLAVASGIAAAGLAAFPLTIGFFKDELFFAAALERGTAIAVLAVIGASLTFAYMGRFWGGIFLGAPKPAAHPVPMALVAPVVALATLTVAGGLAPGPAAELAGGAATVSLRSAAEVHPAYHLDARAENLMALAAYGGGALLLLLRPLWRGAALVLAALGARLGPERLYHAGLATLNGISDRIHQIEVRDLRSRVATILAPAGVLVTAGFLATPTEGEFRAGTVGIDDIPLLLVLTVAATAAIAAAVPRQHLALALILSGLSYSLAVVYAILGAPNVALVAVLVETVTSLLIFGFLASMPRHVLRRAAEHPTVGSHRWRDPLVGVISGLIAFVVVWAVLSRPAARETVATEHIELTPVAHAGNVVSAILADFRGFDTLGEITVIGIALLGIATLLRGGRLR